MGQGAARAARGSEGLMPRKSWGTEQQMVEIGQRLRETREAKKISQRTLSAPGVTPAYISRVEAGQRMPSLNALRILARGLGVSVAYLETGHDQVDEALRAMVQELGAIELEADPYIAERLRGVRVVANRLLTEHA